MCIREGVPLDEEIINENPENRNAHNDGIIDQGREVRQNIIDLYFNL